MVLSVRGRALNGLKALLEPGCPPKQAQGRRKAPGAVCQVKLFHGMFALCCHDVVILLLY